MTIATIAKQSATVGVSPMEVKRLAVVAREKDEPEIKVMALLPWQHQ